MTLIIRTEGLTLLMMPLAIMFSSDSSILFTYAAYETTFHFDVDYCFTTTSLNWARDKFIYD